MPGLIDTPMAVDATARATRRGSAKSSPTLAPGRCRSVTRGARGTSRHAALFLASDDAAFITGVVLPVDGGQSAQVG